MHESLYPDHGQTAITGGRNYGIDLIKTWAIFGVIVIHVTSGVFYAWPIGSFHWLSGLFWGSVSRASVPLFLMCSGVLFLPPHKDITIKRLYTRYILRG